MVRRIGIVLLFVGLFMLFFAGFERFYAYPRVKKAPLDEYSQPVAEGTGTYFNKGQLKQVQNASMRDNRTVRGDVKAGSSKTAVWDMFHATQDTADGTVINAVQERIVLDRVTAEPVHCCGERPTHQDHALTLKFPFDAQKKSYLFWDDTAKAAFPAEFDGVETLKGLKVYRYIQQVPATTVGTIAVSGEQAGHPTVSSETANIVYTDTTTVWVEPVTGLIVKGDQVAQQRVVTADGSKIILNAFDARLTWNDATVKHFVARGKDKSAAIRLLRSTLPVTATVLGVVLFLLGLVLGRTRPPAARRLRTSSSVEVPEHRPAETA